MADAMKTFLGLCGISLLSTACGASSAELSVKEAASVDLGCSQEEITVIDSSPHERTVEGCGRQGVYAKRCHVASRKSYQYSASYYGNPECRWRYVRKPEEGDEFVAPEDEAPKETTGEASEGDSTEVVTEGSTENTAEGASSETSVETSTDQ